MASSLGLILVVAVSIHTAWAERDCYSKKADIVFIMDESSSIYPQPFNDQKLFISKLIDHFDIGPEGTRVGLLSFASTPRPVFDPKTFKDKESMEKTVMAIRQKGGNTYTWDVLDMARQRSFTTRAGSRMGDSSVPKIAIVITDGNSQEPLETAKAAQDLRNVGVVIYAIGVGREATISQRELIAISGNKNNVFRVESYDKLKNIENDILDKACVPETPAPPTLPPVTIFEPCEDKKADVLFVMDTSENAMDEQVEGMKEFLGELVYSLDIGADKTRVGLITYSATANLQFGFDTYNNHQDIYSGIKAVNADLLPQANLMEALKMANQQNFNPSRGGRTKIAKALVLITPGKSSDSAESIRMARNLMTDRGVKIIGIALTGASRRELSSVAGASDVIEVADVSGLPAVKDRVAGKICRSRPPPNDFACGEFRGIDIAFVMDTQSAGGHDMVFASEFMQKASAKFEIGPDKVQVSVVPAECKSLPGFVLDKYATKEELIKGMVVKQEYSLGPLMTQVTSTTFAASNGARPKAEVDRAIVIVTDGTPDQASINKAAQAKADGIEVFVVGVGKKVNSSVLASMASDPAATHVYGVPSYQELVSDPRIVDGITATICQS
ncbi:cartilage matrix protein-like isoform X2 [Lineus longissimus]|uniref:cartilage matrix protein-like isoform X2 n=1 Tax=Lineus longissimus TaxID=88925 RepID=UPI002B4F8D20